MKIFSLILFSLFTLLGCSKVENMNLKCDGKLSTRSELIPENNKDYKQNIEMIFKIKDSQIYQMNHDGYVLLTVGEEGMSCKFDNEKIICNKTKDLNSSSKSIRTININRISGVIETQTKTEYFNDGKKTVGGISTYTGNCEKIINKI